MTQQTSRSLRADEGHLSDEPGQAAVLRAFMADLCDSSPDLQHIETHASHIIVNGRRAYKIKRAVRYSYLDYATLEKRHAACLREFEINHKYSPNLYLGVEPLVMDGKVVEWMIVMRRFGAGQLFSELAGAGKLTADQVCAVSAIIAQAHEKAARVPLDAPHGGGMSAFAQTVRDTVDNIYELSAPGFQRRLSRLAANLAANLAKFGPLLDRRLAQGHVRACHGDLHLGNICVFEGKPCLFDAVEFNPTISHIDTLYDIAFLWMDLIANGEEGLANLSMNTYLAEPGGFEGLAALPLFLSTRALIRCMVAMTRGDEAEAARYQALASLWEPAQSPSLTAIGGLSGSGKTTVAAALAPQIGLAPGAVHLRSDVIRKSCAGLAPLEHAPPSAYTPQMTELVYDTLLHQAERALKAGMPVVLDAVFQNPAHRKRAESLATQCGVSFHGIWLEAPMETRLKRVAERQNDASDADAKVVRAQNTECLGAMTWHRLTTKGTPAIIADDVLNAIKSHSVIDPHQRPANALPL